MDWDRERLRAWLGSGARDFEKVNVLPHVWCIIEDVEFGNWGAGGRPVTPELLKAVLEGKKG